MKDIVIRLAKPDDAEALSDFSREAFYETFAPFNTKENMDKFMNEQFTRDGLIREVGAAGNTFLIALQENELVGYAKLSDGKAPVSLNGISSIEIARIYAATKMIGKGIGSQLIRECMTIAKQWNREVIWLGVWEQNLAAIEFYHKWGFEKFGDHAFILGDDVQNDWLMKKVI